MEHEPLISRRSSRRTAYAASAVCCVLSGSFTVFSLYTATFESLGYTPLEINYVSICAVMGLYLCVPILGLVADTWRLSAVGSLGGVASFVGYAGTSWTVHSGRSWPVMAAFFAIVGVGCSATFISSLVNCARLFPGQALLAISVPTTLYGVSSLVYARLVGVYLAHGHAETLFLGLGVVLGGVGVLAGLAPVWGGVDVLTPERSEDALCSDASEPDTSQPPQSQRPQSQQTQPHQTQPPPRARMLLLLLTFILVSGPLEMYQNNVGLIVQASGGSTAEVAHQVALFTGCSTLARLVTGAAVDALRVAPPALLLGVLVAQGGADLAFAHGKLGVSAASALSGAAYGASFTVYPLVVSRVWGIRRFASHWGLFILGPAVGLLVFGLVFGHNMQVSPSVAFTFALCGAVTLLSAGIVLSLRLHLFW